MATSVESRRIVIAGASSLLGCDLKSLLEESRFAASDFRLVDEETVAGILTEAGGEPAVIQPVEEDSFNKAWIIFFTGSATFTKTNLELAKRSGARIVDLSGELAGQPNVAAFLPNLDQETSWSSQNKSALFAIPSAPAEIVARLSYALHPLKPNAISAVAFQPVSAIGQQGIEELESQTSHLLSLESIGQPVFDTQVAFTLLDRYGPASAQKLQSSLAVLRKEVRAILPASWLLPSLQLLHAPIFYGTTVTLCARLDPSTDVAALSKSCVSAGFAIPAEGSVTSNISSAGESSLQLSPPQSDPAALGTWWFWAAADNLRRPAFNGVKLAEKFLA
jgi:aspartate-semialdehyde dehydrogenase